MMKSLNDGQFDDLTRLGWPHGTPVRCILVQRPVRSPGMLVVQVRRMQSLEVPSVEEDGVIQKLSGKAANLAFNISSEWPRVVGSGIVLGHALLPI